MICKYLRHIWINHIAKNKEFLCFTKSLLSSMFQTEGKMVQMGWWDVIFTLPYNRYLLLKG
jgi:hypothetical protein